MGPRAGLDGCGKSLPPLGFSPRTVQSVASRYTDYSCHFSNTNNFNYIELESLRVITHKGKGKGKIHPRTGHEDPRGE